MQLQGRGWVTLCNIAAYSFSFLVFGMQVNLLGPTASVLATRVGVIEPDLGVIFTINGLASIIGALPSGWLVDKLPGHAVLASALAFEALGFALIPYAYNLTLLAAAFGSVALSWNIVNTAGNTYILWIGNADKNPSAQGFLINLVNALFGAGSLAAPIVAEFCSTQLSQALSAYWITGALTAASAVAFLLLPSPTPPQQATTDAEQQQPLTEGLLRHHSDHTQSAATPGQQDQQQADEPCSVALNCGSGDSAAAEEATDSAGKAADASSTSILQGYPAVSLLVVIAVFNFLNVGTEVAFGGWVFTYAIKQAGLSTYEGHFLNASYWAAFTLGRVIASFAAVVLAPATLLFASLPLAIAGAAVALLTHSDAVWLLLFMSCVLIGMGVSAGFANALALLDTYIPCTGSITGLLGGLAGAGCMTVPLVVAVLAKHTALQYQGLMWVSLVSFVAQLACVPVALAFGKRLAALQYVQKAHEDLLPATI
eukprot:GHRR01004611.1.p1 GENE.GHRR01004611.1~~GHRR01004611.1.p1  ORF type:complete len:484 (+),score=180.38 GHRR01004611.1:284-1735(+)